MYSLLVGPFLVILEVMAAVHPGQVGCLLRGQHMHMWTLYIKVLVGTKSTNFLLCFHLICRTTMKLRWNIVETTQNVLTSWAKSRKWVGWKWVDTKTPGPVHTLPVDTFALEQTSYVTVNSSPLESNMYSSGETLFKQIIWHWITSREALSEVPLLLYTQIKPCTVLLKGKPHLPETVSPPPPTIWGLFTDKICCDFAQSVLNKELANPRHNTFCRVYILFFWLGQNSVWVFWLRERE